MENESESIVAVEPYGDRQRRIDAKHSKDLVTRANVYIKKLDKRIEEKMNSDPTYRGTEIEERIPAKDLFIVNTVCNHFQTANYDTRARNVLSEKQGFCLTETCIGGCDKCCSTQAIVIKL